MQIGEKIKSLRQSKLMTQSELAGTQITRNMLSTIEHGTALPSLPTALYLAERLNVPVGYLLAEDEDEPGYHKMMAISNIRHAFASKDYRGTLSLLQAVPGADGDDELCFVRAQCEFGIARAELQAGRLRPCALSLDRALRATEQTIYDTSGLRSCIAVYFRYLQGVSSTIDSDVLDVDEIEGARALGDDVCEYVLALEQIEQGSENAGAEYARRFPQSPYATRLRALEWMRRGEYLAAQTALEELLPREDLTFGVLLYDVFGDLEVCYRKNDDYKRAYEFAGSRLGLLERLLEEI